MQRAAECRGDERMGAAWRRDHYAVWPGGAVRRGYALTKAPPLSSLLVDGRIHPVTRLRAPPFPKAWPFEEAAKVARPPRRVRQRTSALFETGYGPSGLPHIGTFGEVARTSWVRHAFTELTGLPSRLLAFSDDMDGLRKVPDNVPNRDMLAEHLGKPLTRIPDPFGTHESFGAHNNARLRAFLDGFGFDYEFASATEYYTAGRFDAALVRVLERLRRDHGRDPADARPGAPRDLLAHPADPSRAPAG